MKFDAKSLLVGAVFAALVLMATGAVTGSAEHIGKFEINVEGTTGAYRLDTATGAVLYWNGHSWREISPK